MGCKMKLLPEKRNRLWFVYGALMAIIPYIVLLIVMRSLGLDLSVGGYISFFLVMLIYSELLALMGFFGLRVMYVVSSIAYLLGITLVVLTLAGGSQGIEGVTLFLVAIPFLVVTWLFGFAGGLVIQGIATFVAERKQKRA